MARTTDSSAASPPTLEVRRVINAPRERVFDAWTKPEEMKRWKAPGPLVSSKVEVDLRVGGQYRVHMREPTGVEHRAVGVYREIDRPRRLVYTWTWEDDPSVTDTVITVEFHERGAATEVVLRHDGLVAPEQRARHEEGWVGCLVKLEQMYTS
jgi:uncharacterized protein YndB with AHSA1/START domain